MTKKWWKCAGIRALKTTCQGVLSGVVIGATVTEIDWVGLLSVGVVAGMASILTSIVTGIPEVEESEGVTNE